MVAVRLAGDAVLELWEQDGSLGEDRAAARLELTVMGERTAGWYRRFAAGLVGDDAVPDPLVHDAPGDERLVDAVDRDLRGEGGETSATAIRVIWTWDHLDAIRRLQESLVEPARAAVRMR